MIEAKKKRHSWIWQQPALGYRRCKKCGRVLEITEHMKVGECRGS